MSSARPARINLGMIAFATLIPADRLICRSVGPYHLGRTMGVLTMGSRNPVLRHDDGRAYMSLRTPAGPVVIKGLHQQNILRRRSTLQFMVGFGVGPASPVGHFRVRRSGG